MSLALFVLLEQLTPLERAVFLLRKVFDFEYAEIGQILEKEETACRKLFSRVQKHIAIHRSRFHATPEQYRQLLNRFIQAVSTGEMDGLMRLLAEDVTMWADGGGKARGRVFRQFFGFGLILLPSQTSSHLPAISTAVRNNKVAQRFTALEWRLGKDE